MATGSGTSVLAPDFIRYLFSSKPKFDCYFKVGNKKQGKQERIGGVKLMMMAHSEVFRLELEDSRLKEKEDVPINDVHPDTFRGMLRYMYGYDTTAELSFDEADNLLYVAEKYLMKTLKDKLALRLMDLLNPDNICSLLNNPACHTHLELNSAITEILRYETDRVLASPQFLWMNADGFVKILEQDGLAVPEIELWRAAIKWAKHRANSEDGRMLRQQLSALAPRLRLCALTGDEVCTEVATTDVFTKEEIGAVCQSVGRKRKLESLTEISDEIAPRKRLMRSNEVKLANFTMDTVKRNIEYVFYLTTKENAVELLPVECLSKSSEQTIRSTITITQDITCSCKYNTEPQIVFFSEKIKYGERFEIPLTVDGSNITLRANAKYRVEMSIKEDHKVFYSSSVDNYENDHLKLRVVGSDVDFFCDDYKFFFPSERLRYRLVLSEERP